MLFRSRKRSQPSPLHQVDSTVLQPPTEVWGCLRLPSPDTTVWAVALGREGSSGAASAAPELALSSRCEPAEQDFMVSQSPHPSPTLALPGQKCLNQQRLALLGASHRCCPMPPLRLLYEQLVANVCICLVFKLLFPPTFCLASCA